MIFPLNIPIPYIVSSRLHETLALARILSKVSRYQRRWHIKLDYITVPLISVLTLWVSGAIDTSVIRRGILGADGIVPIDIMALFISLVSMHFQIYMWLQAYRIHQAYLSISLDFTGLLRFSAFWVARKGGASGQRLYFYLYVFFLLCGVIVGNVSGQLFLCGGELTCRHRIQSFCPGLHSWRILRGSLGMYTSSMQK